MQETDKTANQHMNYRDICPRCGARRVDAQIGLESTPAEYVAHIVAVMRECWRVLKDDGVLWLNLGDSYATIGGNNANPNRQINTGQRGQVDAGAVPSRSRNGVDGLKPKDLCGIPWRVAFALQDDGWYLRSDIIWHKPNPMPESVIDRPTKSHEYVFLLTKRERYYYDAEAIKEAAIGDTGGAPQKINQVRHGDTGLSNGWTGSVSRNRRSVWTVATQPYSGAHFATFPPALIEPMILAGTSARGECPHCGNAWIRVVEKEAKLESGRLQNGYGISTDANGQTTNGHDGSTLHHDITSTTIGWQPQCSCWEYAPDMPFIDGVGFKQPLEPIPQTVLDPFAGSGTSGAVAIKHGRKAVLLDLNTKYIDLQFERNSKIQITMQM